VIEAMNRNDPNFSRQPIYSRVTGRGAGGIATLLLDGDETLLRFEPRFASKRKLTLNDGELQYGRVLDSAGKVVDEVVVATLSTKKSPTGNLQIELSCHGGEGSVAAVEAVLRDAGFAEARGTELLERAHLNGKLSLIALEARVRLAAAATARQASFLLGTHVLQEKWERLGFDMALGLREKRTDWRETIVNAADAAIEGAAAARALLRQHTLTIVGPVNAGKSTLANLLARAERHIVSAEPGTTRDKLDTPLDIRGLNVLLSDTAGLRESTDAIEQEGQRRARDAAQSADLRLLVLDGSRTPGDAELELIKTVAAQGPVILVLNKKDLGLDDTALGLGFTLGREPCAISAQNGDGLKELEDQIEARLLGGTTNAPSPDAPFTTRQVGRLKLLREGLMGSEHGMDVIVHLRKLVGTRPDGEEMEQVIRELWPG
jgi:tRNA modification GTPase